MSPIKMPGHPRALAISPDGRTAYVVIENLNVVIPIDLASQRIEQMIKVGTFPDAIALTPDGKTAYVVNLKFQRCHPY